jgi:hypothetical protein
MEQLRIQISNTAQRDLISPPSPSGYGGQLLQRRSVKSLRAVPNFTLLHNVEKVPQKGRMRFL